jgi:hypothetical protein
VKKTTGLEIPHVQLVNSINRLCSEGIIEPPQDSRILEIEHGDASVQDDHELEGHAVVGTYKQIEAKSRVQSFCTHRRFRVGVDQTRRGSNCSKKAKESSVENSTVLSSLFFIDFSVDFRTECDPVLKLGLVS